MDLGSQMGAAIYLVWKHFLNNKSLSGQPFIGQNTHVSKRWNDATPKGTDGRRMFLSVWVRGHNWLMDFLKHKHFEMTPTY